MKRSTIAIAAAFFVAQSLPLAAQSDDSSERHAKAYQAYIESVTVDVSRNAPARVAQTQARHVSDDVSLRGHDTFETSYAAPRRALTDGPAYVSDEDKDE